MTKGGRALLKNGFCVVRLKTINPALADADRGGAIGGCPAGVCHAAGKGQVLLKIVGMP